MSTPPCGSSLFEMAAVAHGLAYYISCKPGVEDVYTYAGCQVPKFYYAEESGGQGDDLAQLMVVTGNGNMGALERLIGDLRQELPTMYPGTQVMVRQLEQGPPVGALVRVRIYGDDLGKLHQLTDQVTGILGRTPGTLDVHDDMGPDAYTVKVDSDPLLTARWGVSAQDVAESVRLAVDGLQVSDYRQGEKLYPIVLHTSGADAATLTTLSSVWVPSWETNAVLPLSQVASLKPWWTTGAINRRNLSRIVTVSAYTDGTLPSAIVKSASLKINAILLPPGYRIEYGGEIKQRDTAFADLGRLFILVALLLYLILVIQLYSLLKPVIIMLSVYLAMAGAVLGLFVTGSPIGFMAMLGATSLSGIVVRNGIVLLDFVEHELRRGAPLLAAIRSVGRVRLRPILLTAATATGGLLPMAVAGGNLWRPLAVSIISGVIFYTSLTLIVVPNVYLLVTNFQKRRLASSP